MHFRLVHDDALTEGHFETFGLKFTLPSGIHGIDKGSTSAALVKIFDYGEGVASASSAFYLRNGSVPVAVGAGPVAASEPGAALGGGWRVVGNGLNEAWVDANGLYSVDAKVASDDYDQRCDFASPTAPCGHSCAYGGPYADSGLGSEGRALGVLELPAAAAAAAASASATGAATTATTTPAHVATDPAQPLADWPTDKLSVTLWVKAAAGSAGQAAVLASYELPPSLSGGAHEFVLSTAPLPSAGAPASLGRGGLRLMIHGLDTGKRSMGLSTGVAVDDGEWHFVAVTWQSAGGEVVVYVDGEVAFSEGPYRTGVSMTAGGALVLGAQASANCTSASPAAASGVAGVADCPAVPGTGFAGQLQNLRVWSRVRSARQVRTEMKWPFTGNQIGLILYWHFSPSTFAARASDGRLVVTDQGFSGADRPGIVGPYEAPSSASSSMTPAPGAANVSFLLVNASTAAAATSSAALPVPRLAAGTPSTPPHYPCGDVHTNVWHFVAPDTFLGNLLAYYNSRLQFKLMASSHTGTPRSTRGAVEMTGANGMRVSYPMAGFALPRNDSWTGYSVIFNEAFGWVTEPDNVPVTFLQLRQVLANVTSLLIRGDLWQYSRSGYGQEALYLQNCTLWKVQ